MSGITRFLLLSSVWASVSLAVNKDIVGLQADLHLTETNPGFYDTYWVKPYSLPDSLAFPCQDYGSVEAAANEFRAAYGLPPLVYSRALETQVVSYMAAANDACDVGLGAAPVVVGPIEFNSTGVALGCRVHGRTLSYKCVQAVNFWAQFEPTPTPEDPGAHATAFHTLMSEEATEIGCGLHLCSHNDDPEKDVVQYYVYCLVTPATLDNAEDVMQAPAQGCPTVYITKEDDTPDTLTQRFAYRNLTRARLMCYNHQYGPDEFQQAGVPLAIPCAGTVVPNRCPDFDLYQRGRSPGTCPTTYRMKPGDTIEAVARMFDMSADELCCYNIAYNSSGFPGCAKIPPFQGAVSVLTIPCAEELRHRNCSSAFNQDVMACPDSKDAELAFNDIRSAYGLDRVEWSEPLAATVMQAVEANFETECLNYTAMATSMDLADYSIWITPTASCSSAVVRTLAGMIQLKEYLEDFAAPDEELEEYREGLAGLALALMSPDLTSFGCAVQLCGPYQTNVFCIADGFSLDSLPANSDTYVEALTQLPETEECPRLYTLLEGDTIESVAARNNLTVQEIMCNYDSFSADDALAAPAGWATLAAVALPCPSATPEDVTCPAWKEYQVLHGSCPGAGFEYTVRPGDTFEGVAARFPGLGLSACTLCCMQAAGGDTCLLQPGATLYMPCQRSQLQPGVAECACPAVKHAGNGGTGSSGGNQLALILGLVLGSIAALAVGAAVLVACRRNQDRRHRLKEGLPISFPGPDVSSFSDGMWTTSTTSISQLRDSLSANSWVLESNELQFVTQVGKGAQGVVYLGALHQAPVAIKCLKLDAAFTQDNEPGKVDRSARALAREIQLLTQVHSPYTVMFLGMCLEPLACVTEYCAHGSLYGLLAHASRSPDIAAKLTWHTRVRMALHAALGMSHLHDVGVIHCDLKAANLFVDENYKVKVGDFGLSILSTSGTMCGASTIQYMNRRWMAPEVAVQLMSPKHDVEQQPFTPASDVYSFGLVLLELATWKVPFPNLIDAQVFVENSRGQLQPMLPSPSELAGGTFPGISQYLQLLSACCAFDPAARPSFEQIVRSLRVILRTTKATTHLAQGPTASTDGTPPSDSQPSSLSEEHKPGPAGDAHEDGTEQHSSDVEASIPHSAHESTPHSSL